MKDFGKLPGLWVQLSPELQAKADTAWEEHMAKSPEKRMREYYESALRGLKLVRGVLEQMQEDANVEAINKDKL